MDAHVDVIVDWLHAFSPELKSVGFEAGALSQYLTSGLQAAGVGVICLAPRVGHGSFDAQVRSTFADNPRHISRAGDADVRSALYVAAHSLLTRNA